MPKTMFEADAIRKEVIRAGATYPSAVPSSYSQPLTDPCPAGGAVKKGIGSTSSRNTRLRPAFGATRDEGAIGPINALSPYAGVVDFNQRQKKRTLFNENCRKVRWAASGDLIRSQLAGRMIKGRYQCGRLKNEVPEKQFEFVANGPTAETIISMTATGRKPPVPEPGQVEKHKESLSQISAYMATAVSSHVDDKEQSIESIRQFND